MSVSNIIKTLLFSGFIALTALHTPSSRAENSALGLTNIMAMQSQRIDVLTARKFLEANPQTIVLDIRTKEEIKSGFIVAAKFLDFYSPNFQNRLKDLDHHKIYLIHCSDNGISLKAYGMLKDLGYTNILHMDGGLDAWKAAGLPVSMPYYNPVSPL